MKRQRIVLIVIILGIMAGYCIIAIQTETGPTVGVEIDLSRPASIIWPCEVDYIGDHGEKGLRIPPNVGRGWLDEVGGSATYKFYIPKENQYYVWAYCKWHDECTNAVYARIDDLGKTIVGNDPIYGQWHWVRGFPVHLEKGTHTLILANHSDNIELLKVILMNSASAGPDDSQMLFSDLFYDGFDGCDEGNFGDWKIVSGDWKVVHRADMGNHLDNALVAVSETNAFIVYDKGHWSDYSARMMVKVNSIASPQVTVAIYFGMDDLDIFYKIAFTTERDTGKTTVSGYQKTGEEIKLLGSSIVFWKHGQWQHIEIGRSKDKVVIGFDGEECLNFPAAPMLNGGIGLQIEGDAEIHFDNVHIQRKVE